ncbi:ATP-binding cassette domain-containing protein [Pedobacter punctiformis]|uniref:ABC transporter ATP-binding protein n=1 Tax=Pedobacter punctiformis TaxID=3004097 RepID=A0ABT4L9N5_9SPHI|nr:ABC transporter ATP-binding protein [Pedobacter sp. HCMS5-2]MCZ4244625.1 ABC transporter ATP-binding protein [Pedobacter sp. HCMS5-2]
MIRIQNLTFAYQNRETVLENLSLEIKPGHIYGLLGPNGAGKSSLLYQICGLIFPKIGSIEVIGEIPSKRTPSFLQSVYLLPEEVDTPNISIKSYLKINKLFYPSFDLDLFNQLLAEFEISETANLSEVSYGQKKKVMIAFAIATQAKILIMDEPTNGLDIPSKRQFRKVMAGILQDDQTIIISTHQVRDLDQLIDYVLILDDKKILLHESIDTITEKLVFKQVMNLDLISKPFYVEGGLKGYVVVAANEEQEHSKLDMELFFNAVLSEKNQILPIFNHQ